METIEFMVANDFVLSDDRFHASLQRLARNGSDAEYENMIQESFRKYGEIAKFIAENGEGAWQAEKIEDGIEAYVARHGETTAYAIPQKQLSPATQQLLKKEKIDTAKTSVKHEVLMVISTPEIDFGHTWTFFRESSTEMISDITPLFLAHLAVKGLTAIFNYIIAGVGKALAVQSMIQAAQSSMQAGLAKGIVIKFIAFVKGASLAAAVLAVFIKIVAFIVLVFIIFYIINNLLFQTYQSQLILYNITNHDVVMKIPYLYNASDNTKPSPNEVNELNLTLKKMANPGDYGDFHGLRIKYKTRTISIATLQVENDNTFFQGLGWVVKLINPVSDGFQNIVGTLSVPRFEGASISVLFNHETDNYEGWFNDESGKNQVGRVEAHHNHFKAVLTSEERSTPDGYNYFGNLLVVDTSRYDV